MSFQELFELMSKDIEFGVYFKLEQYYLYLDESVVHLFADVEDALREFDRVSSFFSGYVVLYVVVEPKCAKYSSYKIEVPIREYKHL